MSFESGKRTTLAKPVSPGDTTIYLKSAPTVTSGRLYIKNDAQEERIAYTGVSGNSVTGCSRNISKTADPLSSGTGLTRVAGCVVKLVIMHDQLVDKAGSNTITGDLDVSGYLEADRIKAIKGSYATTYATTGARDTALGGNGACLYPYTGIQANGVFYNYNTATAQWEDVDTGTTTPNASTTVAGKVEKATSGEVTAGTATGGTGAELFVGPDTLKVVTDAILTPFYFGSGDDGDVTINSGTTTLTRDMYYNNLTLTSPGVLNPNGYRVYVKGTFSGTGTVSRNGNAGAAGTIGLMGSAGAAGAGGAALNAGSLGMELAGAAGGAGGYAPAVDAVGVAGVAGTATNPSMTNISSVAGGAGGAANAIIGGTGGAAAAATRGALYNYVTNPATLHQATATYAALAYKGMPSGGGGGGGGADYTSGTASGGGGGGAGSSGGFIYIRAYVWNFTGTVTAVGGAGGAGLNNAPSGGGGGGAGGNGGILFRAYKTLLGDCTKTLTGGAGGAAGAGAAGGSTGTAGTAGNAGETISITI